MKRLNKADLYQTAKDKVRQYICCYGMKNAKRVIAAMKKEIKAQSKEIKIIFILTYWALLCIL